MHTLTTQKYLSKLKKILEKSKFWKSVKKISLLLFQIIQIRKDLGWNGNAKELAQKVHPVTTFSLIPSGKLTPAPNGFSPARKRIRHLQEALVFRTSLSCQWVYSAPAKKRIRHLPRSLFGTCQKAYSTPARSVFGTRQEAYSAPVKKCILQWRATKSKHFGNCHECYSAPATARLKIYFGTCHRKVYSAPVLPPRSLFSTCQSATACFEVYSAPATIMSTFYF